MSKILTPDASEFLNAETVAHIKAKIGTVGVFGRQFKADCFPDGETREDFLNVVPERLSIMCEAMADNVFLIHKHGLYEHEYAKEVMDSSIECYKEARALSIRIETKNYGEKRGAA